MSLKSRLRRLDAGVRWLETEGVARRKYKMKLARIRRDFAGHRMGGGMVPGRKKSLPSSAPIPVVAAGTLPPKVAALPPPAPVSAVPTEVAHPPRASPPRLAKPRWTKDIRPGPHDVLTSEEAMQVPWIDSMAEDDKA